MVRRLEDSDEEEEPARKKLAVSSTSKPTDILAEVRSVSIDFSYELGMAYFDIYLGFERNEILDFQCKKIFVCYLYSLTSWA